MQVIIDSQPLTVAVLAALLFGESISLIGAAGLLLGVLGLLLLEVLPFPLVGIVGGSFVTAYGCTKKQNSYGDVHNS